MANQDFWRQDVERERDDHHPGRWRRRERDDYIDRAQRYGRDYEQDDLSYRQPPGGEGGIRRYAAPWGEDGRGYGARYDRDYDRMGYDRDFFAKPHRGEVNYYGRGSSYGGISPEMGARHYHVEHSRSQQYRGLGPRGYQRSDDRIREDLCERLTDDPHIDASNLEVTVKGCEVTLSGTVYSRADKRRVADLADEISGVKDVHNNLRVSD